MNRISSALTSARVSLGFHAAGKEQVLEQAARLYCSYEGWEPELISRALLAREALGSTGLGHGFALPHARLKGLHKAVAAYLRVNLAIDFGAPDGKPVSDFLVLLVPEHAGEEHLHMLAQAAAMFSDRAFRDLLRTRTDAEAIVQCFGQWAQHPAAM